MDTQELFEAHPKASASGDRARLADALTTCYQACNACADACLSEDMLDKLRQCIRSDLDCADICQATAAIVSRQTGANPEVVRQAVAACETACRLCAEECEKHADMHEHCRICAEACRACEDACRAFSG